MIAFLQPLRRRPEDGDAGFTLVEMLVVTAMLTIIVGLAMGALISSQVAVRGNATRLDQAQQAKLVMDRVSKNVRNAVSPVVLGCTTCDKTAFTSGSFNTVTFYANVDNLNNAKGPTRFTYSVNGSGTLTEVAEKPTVTNNADGSVTFTYCTVGAAGCNAVTRTLATKVVATAAAPLFTYFADGSTTLAAPLTAGTAVVPGSLSQVRGVDLSVTLRKSTQVPQTTVVNHVTVLEGNVKNNEE